MAQNAFIYELHDATLDEPIGRYDVPDFLVDDASLYAMLQSSALDASLDLDVPYLADAQIPLSLMEVEPMLSRATTGPLDLVDTKTTALLNHESSPAAARASASPTHITDILLTPARSKHTTTTARRFEGKESAAASPTDTGSDSDQSSSKEEAADSKQQERMQRNRTSAAKSRKRKLEHMDELEAQVASLKSSVAALTAQNAELRRACARASGGSESLVPPPGSSLVV
jgi:hypothetical protein